MTLRELDFYFNSFLKKEEFSADPSRNGIQIENSAPDEKQITKVAFAVDASLDTVNAAAQNGAQVLFVHHGLFWGGCETITGVHYKRIAAFVKNDIALCAYHIPLDANREVGNNYGLAMRLGLLDKQDFASWRGMVLGCKGRLPVPMTLDELQKAAFGLNKVSAVLPFGKNKIETVGIASGGSGEDHVMAAREGLDAFITGEVGHEDFNPIKEEGLNVIAGGHYQTETIGVQLVMKKLMEEKGIEGIYLDFPSGL